MSSISLKWMGNQ